MSNINDLLELLDFNEAKQKSTVPGLEYKIEKTGSNTYFKIIHISSKSSVWGGNAPVARSMEFVQLANAILSKANWDVLQDQLTNNNTNVFNKFLSYISGGPGVQDSSSYQVKPETFGTILPKKKEVKKSEKFKLGGKLVVPQYITSNLEWAVWGKPKDFKVYYLTRGLGIGLFFKDLKGAKKAADYLAKTIKDKVSSTTGALPPNFLEKVLKAVEDIKKGNYGVI